MKSLILLSVFSVVLAAGPWKKIPVDSTEATKSAYYAVKYISNRTNSPYHAKLAEIQKAEEQIVVGEYYRLNLTLGDSTCKKSEVRFEYADSCDFQKRSFKKCDVKVYRNWKNEYQVTNFVCSTNVSKQTNESKELKHADQEHAHHAHQDHDHHAPQEHDQEKKPEDSAEKQKEVKKEEKDEKFPKNALGYQPADIWDTNYIHPRPTIDYATLEILSNPERFNWDPPKIEEPEVDLDQIDTVLKEVEKTEHSMSESAAKLADHPFFRWEPRPIIP